MDIARHAASVKCEFTAHALQDKTAGISRGLPPGRLLAYLFSQICVFLVRLIFFCSCSSPYMSASAVGGQPGT